MTILAVFLILFVVKYQKRKIREQEKRRKLIESNQEKVLEAILQTQESERQRIARDLHDELGNALAIAKINISHISRSTLLEQVRETAADTYSILDDSLKNVRRLSRELHPVVLEKYGLAAALEALADKCSSKDITVKISQAHLLNGLSPDQNLNIFRIVQELFTNALKHARATVAELRVETAKDQINLSYKDNGLGFNYRQYRNTNGAVTGLGMVTINTRVRLLQGTWEMASEPGEGTTATFHFPVKQQAF